MLQNLSSAAVVIGALKVNSLPLVITSVVCCSLDPDHGPYKTSDLIWIKTAPSKLFSDGIPDLLSKKLIIKTKIKRRQKI